MSCKEVDIFPDESKKCGIAADSLNTKAVKYSQVSTSIQDSIPKNVACEAYLLALKNYILTRKTNIHSCFLTKSDSINLYRTLSNVRCKCDNAFYGVYRRDSIFKASSILPKDSLLKNNNCEALAKSIRYLIGYKCTNEADTKAYTQKLVDLKCKCDYAYSTLSLAADNYNLTTLPKDSILKKTNCKIYSVALKNYIKIGSVYKCVTKNDSIVYAGILSNLTCK